MSYSKLFLSIWLAFAVIMFLQSWSLAASAVPALLPTLICIGSFAMSALVTDRFWHRVLLCNLLIGFAFSLLHFNIPSSYTSWLGGKLLTERGHHTSFGHFMALLNYAVTVAGNLIGFIGYRYWMSRTACCASRQSCFRTI
jgi:hypothetical protein